MQFLALRNYRWFAHSEISTLYPASPDEECCDTTFVALPDERTKEFQALLEEWSDPRLRQ